MVCETKFTCGTYDKKGTLADHLRSRLKVGA